MLVDIRPARERAGIPSILAGQKLIAAEMLVG
jgi:hypothetical protein